MDIEKELEKVIAKYQGKEVATFETRIDWLAQDCLNEIRRLRNVIVALQNITYPSAIQWIGNNLREVIDLIGWNESASSKWTWEEYEQIVAEKGLKIFTPDGSVMAEIGDWIIENGKDCFVTRQYQKPSDADVAEAIEFWEKIKRQSIRCIKQSQNGKSYQVNLLPTLDNAYALDLAITALRQYQKPSDADVAEAIEDFVNWEKSGWSKAETPNHSNLILAIAALRQYQKPTDNKEDTL